MIIIYLLNVVFISRILLYFNSSEDSFSKLIKKSLIQTTGFIFLEFNPAVVILLTSLLSVNLVLFLSERKNKKSDKIRFWEPVIMFPVILFFASPFFGIKINYDLILWLKETYPFSFLKEILNNMDWETANIFIFGSLLLMLESSLIIKIILKKFNIGMDEKESGKNKENNDDEQKLAGAGKLIGILERVFIYILILLGQFSAIGLIIAAKSFARFKALDKRYFAEYVLIGTLISVMIAFIVSILIAEKI